MLLTDTLTETAESVMEEVEEVLQPSVIKDFFSDFPNKALSLGIRVLLVLIVVFVCIQISKLIRHIIRSSMKKTKADISVIQFVDSILKIVFYVLIAFWVAKYFGLDAASIVAMLAASGVTIGLALQGSLSNFAGGFLILVMKPFTVGDYIIDSGTGKEGTVSSITAFYTRLRTFDNQIVVLPNGNLSNNAVVNVTREKIRRIDIPVSISYSSNIQEARRALMHVLESDETILKNRERRVVVNELGDHGVNLIVRFWVSTEDYWNTKFRVTENVKIALDRANVEIPFPQMDVHMK